MAFDANAANASGHKPGTVEWYRAGGIDAQKDLDWYNPTDYDDYVKRGAGWLDDQIESISGENAAEIQADSAEEAGEKAREDAPAARDYLNQQVDLGRGYIDQGA